MAKLTDFLYSYKVKPENEEFFRTMQWVYFFSFFVHINAIFQFLYLNIQEMVFLGLFISLPVFLTAFIINKRGKQNLAFVFAFFELYFHQVFGTYLLGWDAGFQFWLLFVLGLGFFNPTWNKRRKILQVFLYILAFSLLFIFCQTGIYSISPQLLSFFYMHNGILASIVLAIFINIYTRSAYQADQKLKKANQETRNLLLNILPEPIANQLTKEQSHIADVFENTSIIFADLEGFTKLASDKNAEEVVSLLNRIFYGFDSIVENMGLEKIKTIGDGYMIASGVPRERSDHALAALLCSEKMLNFINSFNKKNKYDLKLRIGINSGSVVAGVMGKNKFSYDLWGDTVNIASRMESNGIAGSIHISESTYGLVKHSCEIIKREPIEIKGKGVMQSYLVKKILS